MKKMFFYLALICSVICFFINIYQHNISAVCGWFVGVLWQCRYIMDSDL